MTLVWPNLCDYSYTWILAKAWLVRCFDLRSRDQGIKRSRDQGIKPFFWHHLFIDLRVDLRVDLSADTASVLTKGRPSAT